uniref:Naphthoate synthase n=1 Tax=Candidatus Kentrum sp. TC TaxID=2126339 RepID=A0A450YT90_9GAMM|nr:MAG: naphthoate synthase [Candidatus Kentron sp. TC]
MVSEIFDSDLWEEVDGFAFEDITYHRARGQGTVRIAIDRPEVRNAFRPHTVDELYLALDHARQWSDVGCVLLTGNGPLRIGLSCPPGRAEESKGGVLSRFRL